MEISILTPCYKPDPCLLGCLESVRAQVTSLHPLRVSVHHHVQDGGSGQETVQLLEQFQKQTEEQALPGYRFTFKSEPDEGMYDAMNRAFAATSGEIIGHLNSDEQYQPMALVWAVSFLLEHTETDMVSGSAIVTRADGSYLCSRKAMLPHRMYTRLCQLTIFTATTFMRRSSVTRLGTYFDPGFRSAGDADLFLRLLESGARFDKIPEYLALFILTDHNLAGSPVGAEEQLRLSPFSPSMTRLLRRGALPLHQLRKLVSGAYHLEPFSYTFLEGSEARTIDVTKPTGVWKEADG